MPMSGAEICVQAAWNAWQSAEVRLEHLQNVHWLQPPGAPRPLLHAYVLCTDVVNGNLPHECHAGAPHRLLVCVLKSHTIPSVYGELSRRAAAQRVSRSAGAAMATR